MRKIQKLTVAIVMVLLTLFVSIQISTQKVEAATAMEMEDGDIIFVEPATEEGDNDSTGDSPLTLTKLDTPTGLKWDTSMPGRVMFNSVPNGQDDNGGHYYSIDLLKDGKGVSSYRIGKSSEGVIKYSELRYDIEDFGEGDYTFRVCARSSNNSYADSDYSSVSDVYTYKCPSKQLDVPKNIRFNENYLEWDAVENTYRYEVQVFVDGKRKSWLYTSSKSNDITYYFERYGSGTYTFKVAARSENIEDCRRSEYGISPELKINIDNPIKAFVERLYTLVLGREADSAGVEDWTNKLANQEQNGATVSYGFIFSNEFAARGLTNEQKVEIFYNTFLNRAADADGKKLWVDALDAGVDLEKVFEGFVMSTEFAGICNSAGISAGQMSDIVGMTDILNRYRNRNINLTEFVSRCYTKALGRAGDIAGIDSWCMQILTGAWSPRNVAAGFIHSDEFLAKNTTNAEYVSILYRTFLGRELDAPGAETWVGVLDRNEWTRDAVLDGFANSDEFAGILAGFGLN